MAATWRHTVVLARADLAGQKADALELDEVMEPGLGLAAGVRFEQLVGVGRGFEREPGEGEVTQVHQLLSLRFRIERGERDRFRRRGVALELPGRSVAFDGGIGVGVEAGGGPGPLAVMDDLDGARRRRIGGRSAR